MILWLWNFLRGFITIEVKGFSAERFINMAVHRGVYVWDVERIDNGVRLNVSVKGFRRLKGVSRKTNCRVRIARKQGAPFVLFRYRKRKILLGGVIFFVLGLYTLSSFVWRVEITGNERLAQEDIVTFLESHGLRTGAFKYGLNVKNLQRELINHFPDISWADVHIKGTRAAITLSEIIPKQSVVDRDTPCHIVADKEGLITAIVTGAGKPLVKQNDVVKEGEMLVSGLLQYTAEDVPIGERPVHAYAEVWAKRYTAITFEVPYEYIEKEYTGRGKTRYALELLFAGERNIGLPGSNSRIPYENYDRIIYRRQPGVSGDYPLPFILIATEYAEFIPNVRTRTVEEAMVLADRMLTGRIIREFDFEADIIDKRVSFEEMPGHLLVAALITTNERIDQAVPFEAEIPAQ